MRRLKDTSDSPKHSELLKLNASQRLFVQRWMEMFDWSSDIYFQFRATSATDLENELKISEGFHRRLLESELEDFRIGNSQPFSHLQIDTYPMRTAERLAMSHSAMEHHPLYLFHAINTFLNNESEDFTGRLIQLNKEWADSNSGEYRIYFRTASSGRHPAIHSRSTVKLLSWQALPDLIRELTPHWSQSPQSNEVPLRQSRAMEIIVTAKDTNAALEKAIRRYHDYRAYVVASSPRNKPITLDLSEAIRVKGDVTVPSLIPVHSRRFQMRGGTDKGLIDRLDAAMEADKQFGAFVRNFAEAVEKLRAGDLDSALEALVLNQDLAFQGCTIHQGWRYPRYLVEIGSKLVALDWPRRYFDYIAQYCRQPSYAVKPNPDIDDPSRSNVLILSKKAWPFIIDDVKWNGIISRSQWDELLKLRRKEFTQSLNDFSSELGRVQRIASWDLARAVRARNSLVHEGNFLSHHRSIGILLDIYELLLRLHLMAWESYPANSSSGFNQLVNEIENDFEALMKGTFTRQTKQSLCENGWNDLWVDPFASIR